LDYCVYLYCRICNRQCTDHQNTYWRLQSMDHKILRTSADMYRSIMFAPCVAETRYRSKCKDWKYTFWQILRRKVTGCITTARTTQEADVYNLASVMLHTFKTTCKGATWDIKARGKDVGSQRTGPADVDPPELAEGRTTLRTFMMVI
jgi:hypothetical protein